MQPTPEGTAADVSAQDTAGTPADALPVEPTSDGGSAVESQGEDRAASSEPTPEDDTSAEDDGEDEGAEAEDGEQTEEQRKLSRRERQRLREQERIDKAVEERIAVREREAEAAKAQAEREAAVAKAREESAKQFAEYIGEEGESDRLASEIADLNRQIRAEIAQPQGVDLDDPEKGLLAQVAQREARLAEIRRAQGFQAKIAESIWNGIEAHMLTPLQFPEFADPAAKQRFLKTPDGIPGAWNVAREVIRAAVAAEKDAEIAKLKEGHASEMKAIEADRNAWRARAGGAEVVDTSGGTAALGGVSTREQFMALPKEQKDKLRREQPALVADIYARSA